MKKGLIFGIVLGATGTIVAMRNKQIAKIIKKNV